jgi:hypothetical protein
MSINDIEITFATSTNRTGAFNRVAQLLRGVVNAYVAQYETPGAVDRLRWIPAV